MTDAELGRLIQRWIGTNKRWRNREIQKSKKNRGGRGRSRKREVIHLKGFGNLTGAKPSLSILLFFGLFNYFPLLRTLSIWASPLPGPPRYPLWAHLLLANCFLTPDFAVNPLWTMSATPLKLKWPWGLLSAGSSELVTPWATSALWTGAYKFSHLLDNLGLCRPELEFCEGQWLLH